MLFYIISYYIIINYVIIFFHVNDGDLPVLHFNSHCSSATNSILRGQPAELGILCFPYAIQFFHLSFSEGRE